jgi:hypothetical protein
VDKFGDPRRKRMVLRQLNDVDHRLPTLGEAALMVEQQWVEEPRRLTEIVDAIDELITEVWYNRHQVRRDMVESGKTKLVEKETFPIKDHRTRPIQRDIWEVH